ncbi:MAG: DUF5666 domain-containing protein [Terriglobales bacterium]
MNLLSYFYQRARRSCWATILAALTVTAITTIIAGCGSSSAIPPGSPIPGETTSMTLLASGSANDRLSQYNIAFNSVTLTSRSGKTVSLFTTPESAEFTHLNGTAEPLATVNVPQDVYTAASASIKGSSFTCVSLLSNPVTLQTSYFAINGALPTTVTLPSPITVTGTAMGLLLDLQVSQSATFSNCYGPSATYSITPTFTLTPVSLASPPTNVENGKVTGLEGQIASVNATGDSFNVAAADGPSWSVQSNGSTLYQGISGFAALAVGMPVDMDVAIQSDGSVLATRVAVVDPDTTALSVVGGPLLFVSQAQPSLDSLGRDEQGYLFSPPIGGALPLSFGNVVYQTSGQFTNLQSLPFPASFNAATIFTGQIVLFTSHALSISGGPTYVPATTATLMPQTINGAVSAVSSSGSFTTYTLTLAPYDLIPALAVQPGQTTVLTNPSSVVVYVDSSTQPLNTTPLAVGSVLRFNGLIFDDNGTLRMACGQVNDGVTP